MAHSACRYGWKVLKGIPGAWLCDASGFKYLPFTPHRPLPTAAIGFGRLQEFGGFVWDKPTCLHTSLKCSTDYYFTTYYIEVRLA